MRRTTALMSQFKANTQTGENLTFELCKGGYFSDKDEYGLKVIGKTIQDGIPTPSSPVPIQCVKQGTKIFCGNEIITPCDLYEGDTWYPSSGKVERRNKIHVLSSSYLRFDKVPWTNTPHLFRVEHWTNIPDVEYKNEDGFVGINCSILQALPYHSGKVSYYSTRQDDNYQYTVALSYENVLTNQQRIFIKVIDCSTVDECMAWIKSLEEAGTPLTFLYKTNKVTLEQYDPQPVFAPQGTVEVLQEPLDLSANLEATLLTK